MMSPIEIKVYGKKKPLWPNDAVQIKIKDAHEFKKIRAQLYDLGWELKDYGQKRNSHYARINADGQGGGGSPESPEHEFFKRVFMLPKEVEIRYRENGESKKVFLFINTENNVLEELYDHPDGRKLRTDVMLSLKRTDPPEYYGIWGGRVGLEIKLHHAVSLETKLLYAESKIACFEFDITKFAKNLTWFNENNVKKYAEKFEVLPGKNHLYLGCRVVNSMINDYDRKKPAKDDRKNQ